MTIWSCFFILWNHSNILTKNLCRDSIISYRDATFNNFKINSFSKFFQKLRLNKIDRIFLFIYFTLSFSCIWIVIKIDEMASSLYHFVSVSFCLNLNCSQLNKKASINIFLGQLLLWLLKSTLQRYIPRIY